MTGTAGVSDDGPDVDPARSVPGGGGTPGASRTLRLPSQSRWDKSRDDACDVADNSLLADGFRRNPYRRR
jgi:hypothetical protein